MDRKIAERRVFPAVDVNPSGTRKDELLLSPDEFAAIIKSEIPKWAKVIKTANIKVE